MEDDCWMVAPDDEIHCTAVAAGCRSSVAELHTAEAANAALSESNVKRDDCSPDNEGLEAAVPAAALDNPAFKGRSSEDMELVRVS